jgi:hypothetical protein
MAMKITTTIGALLALTICSCDGPVEKALDCAKICDEANECIGGDFDEAKCRKECKEDADQDDADKCEQCLTGKDSCTEDTRCSVQCAAVGISIAF